MHLTAAANGPVTLGLYDPASQSSSAYEFTVVQGDGIQVVDGIADPC